LLELDCVGNGGYVVRASDNQEYIGIEKIEDVIGIVSDRYKKGREIEGTVWSSKEICPGGAVAVWIVMI